MNRVLSFVLLGCALFFCTGAMPIQPYAVPPETKVFLGRVLVLAQHNDLGDVEFSRRVFGPNIVNDSDGEKAMHNAGTLDLTGQGPNRQNFTNFTYYYITKPLKNGLAFWKGDDPLFVAELGFSGIDEFHCIAGADIAAVFHSDPNVGLVNPGQRVFHIAQSANIVTEIAVDGPVEGDQRGCVKSLTIRQHKMSEYIPEGQIR
jgi:hypothetical protein